MATAKNITMKQFNGTDYDTLYPKTIAEQVDGVYSKDEVLSNGTKALFGLTDSAVPDDVLNVLAKLFFNYWWRRRTIQQQTTTASTLDSFTLSSATSASTKTTIYFSSEIEVTTSNKINLINPETRTFSYNNVPSNGLPTASDLQGKYLSPSSDTTNLGNVYYLKTVTNIEKNINSGYYQVVARGTIEELYPNIQKGEWSSVNSTERNAYPDSGVFNGYEYEFIGKPSEYNTPPTRIQWKTYIGTGTYGVNNPNIVTFDFVPKAIYLLYWYDGDPLLGKNFYSSLDNKICAMYPIELSTAYTYQRGFLLDTNNNLTYAKKSSDGKSIYWYNETSAEYQCNSNNVPYTILAIS